MFTAIGAARARAKEEEMTVNEATLNEIGPEEEGPWIETFGSVVRVALAVAAIAGAFALVSGWFGGNTARACARNTTGVPAVTSSVVRNGWLCHARP